MERKLDNNFIVVAVLMDLSKVFDCIPHAVEYPDSSRRWHTVWTPKRCAQIKEKLMQNNINYLTISSTQIRQHLLTHLI